LLKKQANNTF